MGDFDGIENAYTSEKLPPIRPGRYLLEVKRLKMFNARDKRRFFLADLQVLESSGANANEVGSLASWMVKMGTDLSLGNVKGFAAALLGEPEAKISTENCNELVAEDNPAAGERVRADAFIIQTKAGKDFTKLKFTPAETQSAVAA